MVKKKVRKTKKKPVVKRKVSVRQTKKRKYSLLLKNLLIFVVLALISLVFAEFSSNIFFINLFAVLAVVFGFIAVAFFIVFLILALVKAFSNK